MVPAGSPLTQNDQVDRPGVQIAVGRNTAYDLYLGRHLKAAERVFAPTSQAAVELFQQDHLDAVASVRQPLEVYAREHADVRILPGRFMVIEQAVALPKGRPEAEPPAPICRGDEGVRVRCECLGQEQPARCVAPGCGAISSAKSG